LRVDESLAFKDGVADKFGEQVKGAKTGDKRTVDITLSDAVSNDQMRGMKVKAELAIKGVKELHLPELTHDFLHNFGVHNVEQFREKILGLLESRLEYHQRQAARQQVLEHITASSSWELPRDLLLRQAKKALHRRLLEMQEAGMSEEEIKGRQRLLQQDVVNSTTVALKEHFVLQKIAETEKIEASDDDLENEIERIADQTEQSPRRVRAQIEKDDLMDSLYAQVTERKVLDLILESAEYDDVPLEPEKAVSSVEEQAVEGELKDPTAAPPESAATEETPSA
jgi:trigger factor